MNLRWLGLWGLLVCTCGLPAADSDPLKPPAIETQEVPVIPAEFAARLAQYQNTRAAGFSGWDPAGQGMLVRTRFGNSLQLHRVYEPGGRREQITFFDEPASGGFLPKATDEAILLSMSAGGNENYQVYLLDRQQFRTTLLTDGQSRNRVDVVRPDGQQIVVASNKRNGRDTDLYLSDPRKANSLQMLMEVSGEFWGAADWSEDGKRLLLSRYVSANESYPALLDLASGERTDLKLPGEGPASIGAFAFTPDGRSAWIATDALGEFKQLALLDLAGGQYQWHSQDIPWDVSGLEVDPKSGRVAFTWNPSPTGALPAARYPRSAALFRRSSFHPTASTSASRSPAPMPRPMRIPWNWPPASSPAGPTAKSAALIRRSSSPPCRSKPRASTGE